MIQAHSHAWGRACWIHYEELRASTWTDQEVITVDVIKWREKKCPHSPLLGSAKTAISHGDENAEHCSTTPSQPYWLTQWLAEVCKHFVKSQTNVSGLVATWPLWQPFCCCHSHCTNKWVWLLLSIFFTKHPRDLYWWLPRWRCVLEGRKWGT